jgi:hypothetical protein
MNMKYIISESQYKFVKEELDPSNPTIRRRLPHFKEMLDLEIDSLFEELEDVTRTEFYEMVIANLTFKIHAINPDLNLMHLFDFLNKIFRDYILDAYDKLVHED